jgi:hypothetical protein
LNFLIKTQKIPFGCKINLLIYDISSDQIYKYQIDNINYSSNEIALKDSEGNVIIVNCTLYQPFDFWFNTTPGANVVANNYNILKLMSGEGGLSYSL